MSSLIRPRKNLQAGVARREESPPRGALLALPFQVTTILAQGGKALVVTHKALESPLKAFTPSSFNLQITHWGTHTGTNEFQDCDTCVIFGLPWRNPTWSANTFFACQGTDRDILNGDRSFGEHEDIRRSLETGQIVVDVVQAVNRTRSRKVIDDQGNCPPVDIYLLLPRGDKADDILKGIEREMPGVTVKEWDYTGQRVKVKKSNFEEALKVYFKNMEAGMCHATGHVRNVIGMSQRQMARLVKMIKDADDPLYTAMRDTGVSYVVKRMGKANKAYFQKA